MKGYQFTIDNPDKASEILKRGEPKQLFVGDDEGWNRTLEILQSSGVISERKPLDVYYTNAFVPGAK